MRKLILFAALAGTLGFVILDRAATSPEVVAESSGIPPPAAREPIQIPERRGLERVRGELFGTPPAPPVKPVPVAAAAPPARVAPPLPYRYAGKIVRGGAEEVLISKADLVFPVKVGDTLDGSYKVEAIEDERIELLYLPLDIKQRLMMASALDAPRTPLARASQSAPAVQPKGPIVDSRPAQLRWEGPARVQAGADFSVALRVSSSEPLRAAPMQLRFEPAVLQPVSVRPGKFFDAGSFSYRVNPAGSIFVGASSEATPPGADAELVIVTFRPLKPGATAELNMSALSLQGAAGRTIPHRQFAAFRTAIH